MAVQALPAKPALVAPQLQVLIELCQTKLPVGVPVSKFEVYKF